MNRFTVRRTVASSFVLALGIGTECFALSARADEEVRAQPLTAATMLKAEGLRADVGILRHAYETLHPGLYRYNTKEQMAAAFGALEAEFARDRTLAEAYLAFSVFAAKVKCGHTYASFFNQSDAVANALFEAPRVPFCFRWLGPRMIVTHSFADDPALVAGSEVLAIDDVPVASILEQLLSIARADGNNLGKRVAYCEVAGTDRYEAFDVFWPLLFPSAASDVRLRVRGPGGAKEQALNVRRMSAPERAQRVAKQIGGSAVENGPLWQFRMLDEDVGLLVMPTWVLYNTKWDWRTYLDETFTSLVESGARDLIVDVRGNEGGNDVGDVLLSHLIAASVPRQKVLRKVRYRKVPADLLPYLSTWDPSFQDWGNAAGEEIDGFRRLRRDADDDFGAAVDPALPRFTGRLWVLVGATNSSATFEFADMVRQNSLGQLVGQTTGGNQRGINGGAFFFLTLPNSGIELDVPLIGLFPAEERPDAGLVPDIAVEPTIEAIAAGRDLELETVLARIRELGDSSDK